MRIERRRDRGGSGQVFGLTAVLGGAGMAAAGAAIGTAIGSVHRAGVGSPIGSMRRAGVGAGQLHVAGLAFSYPTLNLAAGLILSLAVLGALALAGVVRAAWRQRRAYRLFLAAVEVVGRLEDHPAVTVIAGTRPEAFCAGFLRPRIYISRGALDSLGSAELDAVLAHEQHHRLVRDPLRLACGRTLAHALFFVPVLRTLRDHYAELAELQADRAAVRASAGGPAPLASALLVFDAGTPPGAGGISTARVDSLLGEPPRWRVSRPLLIGSLAMLVAVSFIIWRTSASASAHTTLNVPVLSGTPCLSLMLIAALFVCLGAVRLRPRAVGA